MRPLPGPTRVAASLAGYFAPRGPGRFVRRRPRSQALRGRRHIASPERVRTSGRRQANCPWQPARDGRRSFRACSRSGSGVRRCVRVAGIPPGAGTRRDHWRIGRRSVRDRDVRAGWRRRFAMLWVALVTFPLMTAFQEISDRTAIASGKTLGELIAVHAWLSRGRRGRLRSPPATAGGRMPHPLGRPSRPPISHLGCRHRPAPLQGQLRGRTPRRRRGRAAPRYLLLGA